LTPESPGKCCEHGYRALLFSGRIGLTLIGATAVAYVGHCRLLPADGGGLGMTRLSLIALKVKRVWLEQWWTPAAALVRVDQCGRRLDHLGRVRKADWTNWRPVDRKSISLTACL
jgi:hypothetical protein